MRTVTYVRNPHEHAGKPYAVKFESLRQICTYAQRQSAQAITVAFPQALGDTCQEPTAKAAGLCLSPNAIGTTQRKS